MTGPLTFAFLGKGGVGKTALSALTGKILSEKGKRVLFVDADPARGLATALEVEEIKTIGEAREDIIRAVNKKTSDNLSNMIDYMVLEALHEEADYSIIVMGQTDSLGCYCPLNTLLRGTIQAIASEYDYIVIDAEAGIEQINREVVESVDYPVIVTDNSKRGAKTALMIEEIISKVPKMSPKKTGVIFNRVDTAAESLIEIVKQNSLIYFGSIPPDKEISELDLTGESLMTLSDDSVSKKNMSNILEGLI